MSLVMHFARSPTGVDLTHSANDAFSASWPRALLSCAVLCSPVRCGRVAGLSAHCGCSAPRTAAADAGAVERGRQHSTAHRQQTAQRSTRTQLNRIASRTTHERALCLSHTQRPQRQCALPRSPLCRSPHAVLPLARFRWSIRPPAHGHK